MTERQNTIWMNVTTSASWQRPSVGIVRVERSLCYELKKLYGARFKQCVWKDGKFVEWESQLPEVPCKTAEIQNLEPENTVTQTSLPLIFPILPRNQALLLIGQSLLSLMPDRLRPFFNKLLHLIRPFIAKILRSDLIRRLLCLFRSPAFPLLADESSAVVEKLNLTNQASIFMTGDVLISIGLDWDQPYFNQFYEIRKRTGVKIVSCCYDMIPVLYPQYCVGNVSNIFKSYFIEVADGSNLVLCISKQSEKDFNELLRQTGGATPPTHVFPLGDNIPLIENSKISSPVLALCEEPFILFVSTIERRKNHEVLYRAYHLLCMQGKRAQLPKLVFVGMQGWGVGELMKDIELDPLTQGLIIQLNHLTDADLRALYDAAKFCVFPSLYEGWGLPVGEALAMGKAVISSDRGSLPEVGGDVVTYINPWDVHRWAHEIHKLATDRDQLSNLEAKVKKEYKPRSWIDAAVSVKQAIDSISN